MIEQIIAQTPDLAEPLLTQGTLGVAVVALTISLVYVYRNSEKKIERLQAEKTAILQAWRDETRSDSQDVLSVLKGNSQNMVYLADKIKDTRQSRSRGK